MQRQFTSGSRQAPDPFDQFLEEHNFYRKHTARDASCLFRVISEQMYDTQLHHLAIREKCVTYMRKHRKYFDYLVDRDFDEYLDDMSKTKTYGTLLELQAASYMFERNVLLFQPFDLGNYYNEYRSNFEEVFRIFYTPERHFDSVFTSEYIQEAAICQSICYEILYKDLFKLPDVTFAVEQMLHGPNFETMEYRTETNEDGYSTRIHLSDGRSFELDLPHNTNCILENYKLCHFHYIHFPRYSDDLQRELKIANCEEYDKNSMLIQRTAESFLPNKYVSCVRQLLQEGITPFPYKVAKALDPNMYRNIEFDSWNEMRKELKLQNWYNGDTNFKLIRYSTRRVRKIFQVGAKCHVKLRKSEQDLYTCHIQEIAVDEGQCIVFVEQLGEKRLVPYENLTPLPPDQFKPWTVPYRLQRHMQKYSSVRFTRHYNYRFKYNTSNENHEPDEFACESIADNGSNNYIDDDLKKVKREQNNQLCTSPAQYFKLKQYAHLENFRTHVEYCAMPLTVTHTAREPDGQKSSNQQRTGESSENSRTPSISSTTINRNDVDSGQKSNANSVANNVDHLGAAPTYGLFQMDSYDMDHYNYPNSGSLYMPELQSFYPMYPYATHNGLFEDYGYCTYDGGIPPSGAAYMPAVNGINSFYYVCNNAVAPPGNYFNGANPYFPPPPLSQALTVPQPQQSPMFTSANSANPSYYSNTHFANSVGGSQSPQSLVPPVDLNPNPVNNTPNQLRLANRSVQNTPSNTPLSGRINYDAKKSTKANGNDLPTDIATLRFFYNLGLDYYQNQKPTGTEQTQAEPNNDQEISSGDKQNTKLENANQVSSAKIDANNNRNSPEKNSSNISEGNQQLAIQAKKTNTNPANVGNLSTTGNKNNNQRRYSSRCFSGKDRHMPQRNNTNYGGGGHNQQQQQNYSQRNQHNYNKYSSINHNSHSQQQQHPLQASNFYHSEVMDQQSRQISPTYGYNESTMRSNSAEPQNCRTPTTNNSNSTNPMTTCANNSDQTHEGENSVGHLPVTLQPTANGVYIPIPLTTGPPPPPPYGIFTPHHTTGTAQAPGVGIHPNYMAGPPPQFIAHCGLPAPATIHGTLNSAGTGSDNAENASSSEMATNNAGMGGGGIIGMGPPAGMQFQCPNYPPPPMPFYYATNSVNSASGSGNAPITAAAGGGQLVSPFSHQVAGPTSSNQTTLASPHATMGTQGFYCLQPPPIHPQQGQQVVTQSPSVQSNRNSNATNLPQDNNPNGSRNDLEATNND